MSEFWNKLRKHELINKEKIDSSIYNEAKNTLTPDEFNKRYSNEFEGYYKITYKEVGVDEVDTYLLYEILKSQRESEKSLSIIKGILIIFITISVIGLLFLLVN